MAKRVYGPPTLEELKRQRANLLARVRRHRLRILRLTNEARDCHRIADEIGQRIEAARNAR